MLHVRFPTTSGWHVACFAAEQFGNRGAGAAGEENLRLRWGGS